MKEKNCTDSDTPSIMKLSLMATILVAFVYATYMLVVWEIPKSVPNTFFGITNINPEKFVFFKLFFINGPILSISRLWDLPSFFIIFYCLLSVIKELFKQIDKSEGGQGGEVAFFMSAGAVATGTLPSSMTSASIIFLLIIIFGILLSTVFWLKFAFIIAICEILVFTITKGFFIGFSNSIAITIAYSFLLTLSLLIGSLCRLLLKIVYKKNIVEKIK